MASSIPIPLRPVACIAANCGLERPPRFPWQRSGVAPDHFSALPPSKLRVAPYATSMFPTISPRPWVTLTVTGMVTCVFHAPVTFPRQERPPTFPRISIRNGFTRPTGDINVNSPLFTKRHSREEILTENLFDLPSPPVGRRPLSVTPTSASAVHFRFAVPRETNRTECDSAFVANFPGEASVICEKLIAFLDG